MADNNQKTSNVLCLDGGGVRGLSTLIILRKLLCLVNDKVNNGKLGSGAQPLLPLDVFDIVVGTSTGGLIALMIVKLGMNVDKCIETYKTLSEEIFSHWHLASLFTFGFGRVKKYCGKHLRKVLVDQVIKPSLDSRSYHPERLLMKETSSHEGAECTVVCRELDPTDMMPTDDPVCLCTHPPRARDGNWCHSNVRVADAARATSAAPTYFSHVNLVGKLLVDGGFGHTNNPSFVAWDHYFLLYQKNYSRIQFVNIGTGTLPKHSRSRRGTIERIPNEFVKNIIHTILGMKKITTDSIGPTTTMKALAQSSHTLKFNVFSANKGGIHGINLADYKKLKDIENLTNEYLEDESVIRELEEVARELAETYVKRRQVLRQSAENIIRKQSQATPAPVHNEQDNTRLNQDTAYTELETNPGMTTDTSSFASASLHIAPAVSPVEMIKGSDSQLLHIGAGVNPQT